MKLRHHTSSLMSTPHATCLTRSFESNSTLQGSLLDVLGLSILFSSNYLFAMIDIYTYTYALCTAKFAGKIAFGFIKSNMNFPVPKDTKSIYFSALPPDTSL